MSKLSDTAMVLAAGLGTRMRPLTLLKPKPLQVVGGRTMLDHALDKLVEVGIKRAVVNTHYLAEQIETHLKSRDDIEIVISREDKLLDTGGGIAKVLSSFEDKPFFALNADLPFFDGATPSLKNMEVAWDPQKMDVLLLLMRTENARGFDVTKGDFAMDKKGLVWRKDLPYPRPFVWISAQILKPSLFKNFMGTSFSNNIIWDAAESKEHLFGLEHQGTCYHVGTPEDYQLANQLLASGQGWVT